MRNLILIIVILCLAGCADKGGEENHDEPSFAQAPAKQADKGEVLYTEKCLACHGADGSAGIAGATDLKASRRDSIEVALQIINGKNAMPGLKTN
jgi:mono/diheme cytochrome c family protein